ncbi:carbonic anhydrase [Domibacillus sp. DTU_2020_1001157_1_SI_ALB_TIR_016]|uniref:beta-class carbonic anhydrase n=1 Tax=Domibacillus sp. DTU_2020_1001157_1_SI_ALB_TIR_016 TaxID=3077789 RepID=UPI0028EFF57D|nr:carbonic anhydrase [Domibacillus sp. DTU_2020_1001157_1_SI_ALB_TIR_016]WNS78669.1 carbonic anhydrase [Domibacillus sp. DTU_2020_1001157_1_SI_ALB_TIR_016]
MDIISGILDFNSAFVEQKEYQEFNTTKYPDEKLVILTCMDTRLLELLSKAMGLRNIIRSILVAIYELKAEEVCVIGHHACGMTGLQSSSILEAAEKNGVSKDRINTLSNAGIDLSTWLTGFQCVEESVNNSVQLIKKHPLMSANIAVYRMVIHPQTGKLDCVVDGYNSVDSNTNKFKGGYYK